MFDLFNFNIGGGNNPYSTGPNMATTRKAEGVTSVTLKRPSPGEWAKKAKALVKVLDIASIDYYELAGEIWDHTSDAQKIHFYRLVDGLIDRALIHHDDGTAFTLVEKAIGERADLIRDSVWHGTLP